MEAIHELDYRQNEVARSLKRRATKTLGVVIPDALNPFHATVALEVERRAHRDGFAVLVAETENDPATEADQVRALVGRRVDGVIFPAVTAGSTIPVELLDRGVPVVMVSFEGRDPRLGIDPRRRVRGHGRGGRAPGRPRPPRGSPSRTPGAHEEAVDPRPEALAAALRAPRPGAGRRWTSGRPRSAAPTT